MLDVRAIEAIEFIAANPLGSLFCCASCTDSGGKWATALRDSVVDGFRFELEVGVRLESGVGMECRGRLMLRNELKEETATSGDCGERRLEGFAPVVCKLALDAVDISISIRTYDLSRTSPSHWFAASNL